MILWGKSKGPDCRRVLEVCLDGSGFHVGWLNQYKAAGSEGWRTSHVYNWEVYVNANWAWGGDHFWYDGPHCVLSLGFVHFHHPPWGGSCKKCSDEI